MFAIFFFDSSQHLHGPYGERYMTTLWQVQLEQRKRDDVRGVFLQVNLWGLLTLFKPQTTG